MRIRASCSARSGCRSGSRSCVRSTESARQARSIFVNESDIVICSEDATFFDSHVTYGLVSALEPVGLMRKIGLGETLRMALSGNDERVTAPTALRIGLVTEVVTREALWERAHEIAAGIARKPTAATQGTVRAIWDSLDRPYRAAMEQGLIYTRHRQSASVRRRSRSAVPTVRLRGFGDGRASTRRVQQILTSRPRCARDGVWTPSGSAGVRSPRPQPFSPLRWSPASGWRSCCATVRSMSACSSG